jgi:hypothetical protein
LLLPFLLFRAHGAEPARGELGVYFHPEFNRAFYFSSEAAVLGGLRLNEWFSVRGGLALGHLGGEFDIKAAGGGEAALPVVIPLYVGVSALYNGLPAYETHVQSILPLVSLKGRRTGFSIGPNLRFTFFANEPPLFESAIAFAGYVYLLMNDTLRLGLRCANFSDFSAGNTGAYFLNLNSALNLGRHWSLINEIELFQSGSIGLAANFYGAAYRGGVVFRW